jgi:anti-sigma factor RsiW
MLPLRGTEAGVVGQSGAHPEGETLSAYVDNELDAPTLQDVERHLRACRRCTAVVADYRRSSHLIKSLPRPAVPPSLSRDFSPYAESADGQDRPDGGRRRYRPGE